MTNFGLLTILYPMKPTKVLGVILGIVVLAHPILTFAAPQKPSSTDTRTVLLQEVNQARTQKGLEPLTFNSLLSEGAQKKANDMVKRGYFSHSWTYFNPYVLSHFGREHIGENLARFRFSSLEGNERTVFNAWKNSKTHKAVMLDPRYRETGIGIATTTDGKFKTYIVQFFGVKVD